MSGPQAVCLKVDVDTHEGMRDGVPRLLELLRAAGLRATFFLSFGPDNAGKAIFNLLRPGFLKKMVRTGAPSLYGWRTIVSGTLLPARPIAAAMPELVQRIVAEGHEVGVHAWDHRRWQDHLERMSPAEVGEHIARACGAYEEILGHAPRAMAAPAWAATRTSLELQDARGLVYASDMRGGHPGRPVLDGYAARTPQIPSTQPCLEELLTLGERDEELSITRILTPPADSPAALVVPLHAEVEGGVFASFGARLLERIAGLGLPVVTMLEHAEALLTAGVPPERPAARLELEGRSGRVLSWV